jgi:hypothetical protein
MQAGVPKVQSGLNFIMNVILICYSHSQIATFSKNLLLFILNMDCQTSAAEGSDRILFRSTQKVYLHIS